MTMQEYHKIAIKLINRQRVKKAEKLTDIAKNDFELNICQMILEKRDFDKSFSEKVKLL